MANVCVSVCVCVCIQDHSKLEVIASDSKKNSKWEVIASDFTVAACQKYVLGKYSAT